jgi:archaellum component FlaC
VAQNDLNVNILANVKGAEQIAALINRVGALEKEMGNLQRANANVAASTDAVVRNGVRYNNVLDAQSKELRNARQGTQQLGMQINDFATSVSTGASITQAFNQQIGQVGYAMSMMGGTAGRIGNFLAGPWGAAITIGAMALTPLIEKLFQSEDAAKRAADAHYKFMDAVAAGQRAELMKGESDLNTLQQRRMKIEDDLKNKVYLRLPKVLQGSVLDTQGRLKSELDSVNQQIAFLQGAINEGNRNLYKMNTQTPASSRGGGAPRGVVGGRQEAVQDLSKIDLTKAAEAQAFISDIIRKGDAEWRKYLESMSGTSAETIKKIMGINEMATASVNTLSDMTASNFRERYKEIRQAFDNIGMSVNDAFRGMLTGAMSWKDGMKGIINAVINELWRLFVVQQIVGMVSNAISGAFGFGGVGGMPSIASAAAGVSSQLGSNSFFGPSKFANGTVNAPGGMAWVGERGPELVNLPRGSQVIPAHRAQSMGGGGMTINVDARGANDPAAVRAQVQRGILEAAPAIIAAAEARTVSGLRRPRLGSVMK